MRSGMLVSLTSLTPRTRYARKPFGWNTRYVKKERPRKGVLGESGMHVSGYRYYSPSLGRWANRDPIEEKGGECLLAFVRNAPIGLVDPFGLTAFGTFPIPPGVFPVHYLGRSGHTLYYPPGSEFNSRIRATPASASFQLAAIQSVLGSVNFIRKRSCCEPAAYTRSATITGYVLPWHDPDLFLAINRYTLSYKAKWTVDSRCCIRYRIEFKAYDIYDFSTFAKLALVGVPFIGRPFRIEWDWVRSGGRCP